MNKTQKEYGAFLAQNQEILKKDFPLLLKVKDMMEEHSWLKEQRESKAYRNRIVFYFSQENEVSLFSDQPCQGFLVKEGKNFAQIDHLKNQTFSGPDGVDEILEHVQQSKALIE